MRFELTRDATEFAARAQQFVEARVERSVLATVLLGAIRGYFPEGLFACGIDADGSVAAAALRTPPWRMVVSELEDRDAGALISVWLGEDPDLPGVTGLAASAKAVAEAWAGFTGDHSERLVDARLAYRGVYLWDDGGPVCLVGNAPPVAGLVRLGPVYTPPELRGRGYASSAVAARSQLAIQSGLRCTLFTDVANPTSNKIYADVGYRRVADWNEVMFTRPAT